MKIHILISVDPPRYGTTLEALCGAQVPAAQPVYRLDFTPCKTAIDCRQCKDMFRAKFHYVGWIISGEESKQIEGE